MQPKTKRTITPHSWQFTHHKQDRVLHIPQSSPWWVHCQHTTKRTKREAKTEKNKEEAELEQVTKARKKQEKVTWPSRDRFPKTRATARHNRSNTNMTPQRQRQGSTQSWQKQRENQELNKAETPTEMHFPLTSATLTTCMHSQSPVHNKFLKLSKIKQFSPLFDH